MGIGFIDNTPFGKDPKKWGPEAFDGRQILQFGQFGLLASSVVVCLWLLSPFSRVGLRLPHPLAICFGGLVA